MSSDLTFITNEPGKHLRERFGVLLGDDTRLFDCLVGYFFISGFHKLHPALTKTEKVRILIGIKTDRATYELIQTAKEQQEFVLESHAHVRERLPGEILGELQKSGDSSDIEDGVRKFVEWIKSGKLEVRAYPSERVHAKLYVMTFHEGDRDKGRVITGSSNFTEAGLQDNLEFNVELKNRSDYDFALQKFNELWAKAVEVSKDFVQIIENQSPYAQFSPQELYLKFLYEYFRGELKDLAHKLAELERKIEGHDAAIRSLFDAIRQLMAPPPEPRKEIGFHIKEDAVSYLSKFVPQETDEREPNLSFHLANELWKYLFWLNGDFDVTKSAHADKRPDVIFHKRAPNALNFLVVEVKRASNPHGVKEDVQKIREHWFRGKLRYCFGASVLINELTHDFEIRMLACKKSDEELLLNKSNCSRFLSLPKFDSIPRSAIEERARRVVAPNTNNDNVDTAGLKQELNKLVYALYGLTPEEIKIAEEASL